MEEDEGEEAEAWGKWVEGQRSFGQRVCILPSPATLSKRQHRIGHEQSSAPVLSSGGDVMFDSNYDFPRHTARVEWGRR